MARCVRARVRALGAGGRAPGEGLWSGRGPGEGRRGRGEGKGEGLGARVGARASGRGSRGLWAPGSGRGPGRSGIILLIWGEAGASGPRVGPGARG